MKNTKRTRWLIICGAAGLLFSGQAVQAFLRAEKATGAIFGGLALIFFYLTFAYGSDKLRK